jgi:hypothetical protein
MAVMVGVLSFEEVSARFPAATLPFGTARTPPCLTCDMLNDDERAALAISSDENAAPLAAMAWPHAGFTELTYRRPGARAQRFVRRD